MKQRMKATMPAACCALLALLAWLGPLARPAAGQTPADSAAVLVAAAERFEVEGRPEVADALYRMVVRRFAGTPGAELAAARLAALPGMRQARGGMAELTVWGTLFGLWTGLAVPLMLDEDPGPEAIGAGLLLGGPAGFLASRSYARARGVEEGPARAITFGGTWGTWQGFGWRAALDAGQSDVCWEGDEFVSGYCYMEEASTSTVVAWSFAGTVVGTVAGMALAGRPITPGTATAVSFGGPWGTWYGVAAAYIVDEEPEDNAVLTLALLGGNAGILTAALAAPRMELSRNRARIISIAGVVGLLGGLGLDLILQPDDARVSFLIPAATSAGGLAYGVAATRDYDAGDRPGEDGGQSGGPGGPGGAGALLRLREGAWSMELPRPTPRLLHEAVPGRRSTSSATLGITLLDARFF